jgi:hypothetical protein
MTIMSDTKVTEQDVEKVWQNLMLILCRRHRTNARNAKPTGYRIEQLRTDQYGSYTKPEHFKRVIQEAAKLHNEIEVEGDIIRVSEYGLNNCKKYDPTFQRDF